MIITLTQEIYDRCKEFAEKRIELSKNLYAYRGEQKKEKMIEDIIIGTLGEWGAFEYLKSKGILTSEPDMVIYETRRKTFSADIANKDFNFHIKSQSASSASRYGNSWLFQKSDKITHSPDYRDCFIFSVVDGLEVEILGICRIKDICDNNLWGECKVWAYRHTKLALYLKDLIKAGIDLEIL